MSAKWKAVYSRTQDFDLSYLCVMRDTQIFNFVQQNRLRQDFLSEVPVGLFRIGSLGITPVVPPILVRLFIFILRNVLFSYDFMILNTRDCEYPQNP